MRIRKLLLIHPSRSIRGLIKKYLYAELSDIEISEAENGRRALERMAPESFDVVVSTDRLKDMTLAELKTCQLTTRANSRTPLIVITESESARLRDELMAQGFDRVVQTRVRPADLIQSINALCDPRAWRQDARFHIPGVEVAIDLRQAKVKAFLINISMGGILVELATDHPEYLMTGGVGISLQCPLVEGSAPIQGLMAKVLRLESIQWMPDLTPAVMRATFAFYDLSGAQRSELEALFQTAHYNWRTK